MSVLKRESLKRTWIGAVERVAESVAKRYVKAPICHTSCINNLLQFLPHQHSDLEEHLITISCCVSNYLGRNLQKNVALSQQVRSKN